MELIDLPKPFPMSAYDRTRETVRETYRRIEGVVDVVEHGTIPYPGISDMDFIVVIEPGTRVTIPGLKTYSEEEREIMEHAHFVLTSNTITQLRSLDPCIVNFTPLLGRLDLTIDDERLVRLTGEEQRAMSLDFPIVSWILPTLKRFARIECERTIPCRYFLEAIRCLSYAFRELHRAGLTESAACPHAGAFDAVRDDWFAMTAEDRARRMADILGKAREATRTFLTILRGGLETISAETPVPEGFGARTRAQRAVLRAYPQSVCWDTGAELWVYQENRSTVDLGYTLFHSPFTAQTYWKAVHILPLHLCATQNRLLFESGLVPDRFRSRFFTDLASVPVFSHPALAKRTEVTNRMLLETANVEGGKLFGKTYGLRLTPKEGWHWNVRGRLGGMYDRRMKRFALGRFGRLLKRESAQMTF